MVTIPVNNLMVPVGTNSYQMTCFITLSSPIGPNISALSVSWQHNSHTVNMSKSLIGPNFFDSSLTLSNISEHDSGEYCCTASIAGNQTRLEDCVDVKVTTDGENNAE